MTAHPAEPVLERIDALANELEAWGCTEDEVAEVERDQGRPLPRAYRHFLRRMGRDGGGLYIGSDFCFPDILGMRLAAVELLAENGKPFTLPDDAVVILMHQGYVFNYIRVAEGDDPPVHTYCEGDTERRDTMPFTDWLVSLRPEDESYREAGVNALRRFFRPAEPCPQCGGDLKWAGGEMNSEDRFRQRHFADCHSCSGTFWRWGDDDLSPLQSRGGRDPRP